MFCCLQKDEDDWVRVFGHAVGDFTTPLSLAAVADAVPSVGSVKKLAAHVSSS